MKLRPKMLRDMQQKTIFQQAQSYAYEYAAKLEEITESWLKNLFGLPEDVVAGFVSGTSMAIFRGLADARYRLFPCCRCAVKL